MGPGIVAAVGEPSQEEEGELGLQFLVVGGPAVFFVDILGLAAKEWDSLVPAYTSSSIFCEKLRIGAVGKRDIVSNENGSVFPVAVECCPGFPGCFPESCPWLLCLGAIVYTSQSACDELCGQGSAGMSMSMVLSVSLWDV